MVKKIINPHSFKTLSRLHKEVVFTFPWRQKSCSLSQFYCERPACQCNLTSIYWVPMAYKSFRVEMGLGEGWRWWEEIQREKGSLNWMTFNTVGEWPILSQLTVKTEKAWGIHYGSWRGLKDQVIQHRRAESCDICPRPGCMRRILWVRNRGEIILSLKEPHLGYSTSKYFLLTSL